MQETAAFDSSVLIFTAIVLLAAALLLLLLKTLHSKRFPYQSRPILTRREYQFYLLLRRETDARGLLICPKIGLKDLMGVTVRNHYIKYFRRIAQKHVDFVICDPSLRVLFAIELDDSSHDTKQAHRRDRFKDQAFRAARIPLRRIRDFDEATVRALFR